MSHDCTGRSQAVGGEQRELLPKHQRLRRVGRLRLLVEGTALALCSALLYTLAFPPFALSALAWVALAPLLVAVGRLAPAAAAAVGVCWAFVSAFGVTHWLPATIANYYQQPYWLGAALFLGATAVMVAFEYALFAVVAALAQRARYRPRCIVIAAAWVAAEFARAQLLSGNPWAFAGYSQSGSVAPAYAGALSVLAYAPSQVIQVAEWAGVYGVSFVIAVVNAAIAQLILRRSWRGGRSEVAASLAVLVLAIGYGQWRLSAEPWKAGPTVAIAVVQGNLDLGSQWLPKNYGANLQVYLRLTEQVLENSEAAVVVWPENAMTFFVDDEPLFRDTIARKTTQAGVEILAGAPRYLEGSPRRYFNSAFLLSPGGEVVGHYDKQYLLPFAEYFPFGRSGDLRRSFGRVREFTPGKPGPTLPTAAGKAGVVICNEAMFGSVARQRVVAGAEYLVNLSNDSWVADPMFGEQQLSIAAMRAVEQRRYLVRASTSGPSAVVDPTGRVVRRTVPASQAVLSGAIRRSSYRSFYGAHGDVFALACLGLVLLLLALEALRPDRQP